MASPAASRDRCDVGVISDTHGLIRPQALAALEGVAHVLHAGDVGAPEVLEALRKIAPLTAVRGNNDRGVWAMSLPVRATVELARARILVIHDRKELDRDGALPGIAAVVSGHSHHPLVEERDGVLFVNPGSAGPRRFRLPVAVARLRIEHGRISAAIVHLDVSPPPAAVTALRRSPADRRSLPRGSRSA